MDHKTRRGFIGQMLAPIAAILTGSRALAAGKQRQQRQQQKLDGPVFEPIPIALTPVETPPPSDNNPAKPMSGVAYLGFTFTDPATTWDGQKFDATAVLIQSFAPGRTIFAASTPFQYRVKRDGNSNDFTIWVYTHDLNLVKRQFELTFTFKTSGKGGLGSYKMYNDVLVLGQLTDGKTDRR